MLKTKLRKVLFINLQTQESSVKTYTDLDQYIGGVGIGLKLLKENVALNPIIFSVGPLNGFFPFASKTSVVFNSLDGIEDVYIGGSLGSRIRFCGLDSILIYGKSPNQVTLDIKNDSVNFYGPEVDIDSLGLPGKKAIIKINQSGYLLDDYFRTPKHLLDEQLLDFNIKSITITGTKTFEITQKEKYTDLYNKILNSTHKITIEKSNYPSCAGCPLGCEKSNIGEIGGNLLIHSLVACNFASEIYSNVNTVFACLNLLGYDYTHEDIEKFISNIEELLKELS